MDSIKIDWSKPIEAVHTDGRVVSVETWGGVDSCGDCVTKPKIDGVEGIWCSDGTPWGVDYTGREAMKHWRLRNVAPATPTPTRTALEQRMEDLVRHSAVNASGYTQDEARAILAELEPVDGDLLEARKIAVSETVDTEWQEQMLAGKSDNNPRVVIALAAIKRGRALERGE